MSYTHDSLNDSTDIAEKSPISAGNVTLVKLTEDSDDNWGLFIGNSTYITTFSTVTRMEDGGLNCWSGGETVFYVAENDSLAPDPILDALRQIAAHSEFDQDRIQRDDSGE